MKTLFDKLIKFFFDPEPEYMNDLNITVPSKFESKKEQQIFLRQTKNLIIENTIIEKPAK
tara:strand:- start:221 stop:400 length:180 start_codon:yes stop_codon:yes gene_type:complete